MRSKVQLLGSVLSRHLMSRGLPPDGNLTIGRLLHIDTTLLRARLPGTAMGELCRVLPGGMMAEVCSVSGDDVLLSPYGSTYGLTYDQQVLPMGCCFRAPVGNCLLGRVIDGLGRALDDGPEFVGPWRDIDAPPPSPMKRPCISRPLWTGLRVIDSFLTCAEGQRIGIFSAAGVGKTTLLSLLSQSPSCDITVLVFIGERGREVREFLEKTEGAISKGRCVTVIATSDRSALERVRALSLATTIAEAFRDQGHRVLLLIDSLTRYARAAREIALAAGENIVGNAYPATVFAALPKLLERTGLSETGSITAFYTILVEGDNINEPLADELRSLLDGHLILSRRLAESGHFPAIDILASLSRVMPAIVSEEHLMLAGAARQLLSIYREVELLVRVGEFRQGEDPVADQAVEVYPRLCSFLQQRRNESCPIKDLLQQLTLLTKK